jgi:hypothetical protein
MYEMHAMGKNAVFHFQLDPKFFFNFCVTIQWKMWLHDVIFNKFKF